MKRYLTEIIKLLFNFNHFTNWYLMEIPNKFEALFNGNH